MIRRAARTMHGALWRGYLVIALRLLARNRGHAAITLGGLALSLAGCLLILSYVRFERSYDRWLPGSDRLFQVQSTIREAGQPEVRSQESPAPLAALLPARFPGIEAATAFSVGQTVTMRQGEATFIDVAIVDARFFDLFRLPFVAGTAAHALPDTNSVVLTEDEAIKQFGTRDVVGRIITTGAGDGRRGSRVTGVLRSLPANSNLRFGIVVRQRADEPGDGVSAADWAVNRHLAVRLRSGTDARAIDAALSAWAARAMPPATSDGGAQAAAGRRALRLVPATAVHLSDAALGALTPLGDRRALATLGVVAALTLGMALLNFVNMTIARSLVRAREVALRKTLGATRGQLAAQFLTEALVTAAVAMLGALALAELAAAPLGALLGVPLRFGYVGADGMLPPVLGLFAATGLLGGLAPALYMAAFRPADVLRSGSGTAQAPGAAGLRAALVLVQFAAVIGLLASTGVIMGQTRYMARVDPGYRRQGLIQLDAAWRFAGDEAEFTAARRDLLAIPGVTGVGRTSLGLAARDRSSVSARVAGGVRDQAIGFYPVDASFLPTTGVPLLAGRFADDGRGADRVVAGRAAFNVVVNRAAVRELGLGTPQAAIGRILTLDIEHDRSAPVTIVGVVEDMRVRTARDAPEARVYAVDPAHTSQVVVRFAGARPREVMAGLNRVWRRYEPEIPFQGRFAEEIAAETYAADRARGALFGAFTALAVTIACLGLFGLADLAAERRRREIAIRKVFGARVTDIVRLLAWQFCRPVGLANVIAWPLAWWAMRRWLDQFDVRVALGPAPFLIAGALALAIALLTVGGHAARAARASPIRALRHE